jgi:hypothetical protein
MKKILLFAGLFIAGVIAADMVKPMLGKIPVIGSFFGGQTETKD